MSKCVATGTGLIAAFLLSLVTLSTSAVTFDVPRLQTPAFADHETSGDTAIPSQRQPRSVSLSPSAFL